jgi:hypothetical protein
MSRSARSPARPHSLTLKRNVTFTVREAPFRTFHSLRKLDAKRLGRAARARFEVGWFESGCSQRIVYAVVRKGRVTRLEIDPCPDGVRMNAEWRSLAQVARKALGPHRRVEPQLPVPVARFLSNAAGFTIDVFGCFTICIFGYCLSCCFGMDDPKMNDCTLTKELVIR